MDDKLSKRRAVSLLVVMGAILMMIAAWNSSAKP